MVMKNRGILALMGGASACVVALGQGCSNTPATDGAGGEGGDIGGSSTGGKASGGTSTGGTDTGGTNTGGGSNGGDNNGGMGGMGGLVCTGETWFDDTSDSCETCESVADHVLVCADFVDEVVDDGIDHNPKTKWNEATQIFTVQIANGLPSPTSAVFKYEWYCTNVTCAINEPGEITGTIHGDTITFDFGDLADEVNQIGGTTLSVTDDCGVETDVDNLWFADYNSAETFYVDCE